MGKTLYLLIWSLLLVGMASNFAAALTRLVSSAEHLEKFWIDEYESRRCAEIDAARFNIETGREYLTEKHPGYRQEIVLASKDILSAFSETTCVASDRYLVKPYAQQNLGYPGNWPNWFIRFL